MVRLIIIFGAKMMTVKENGLNDKMPKVTEAEWEVMKVLWAKSPLTGNEVASVLSEKKQWSPKTVKTLLGRLAGKKVIGFARVSREYNYYPKLSQDECIGKEAKSFLARMADGASLKPILAAFMEEKQLSQKDIQELKDILDKKGQK